MSFAPLGAAGQTKPASGKGAGFKLKYAPGIGMFEAHAGKSAVDQLKFMADQGFTAWFDNGLMGRPAAEQESLARESRRLGLTIGPFVVYADFKVESFVTRDAAIRDMLAGRFKTAVETAKRTGCKWTLAVPGRYNESLDWDYQTANVVENLKRLAALCEPSGLVIVLEPLNPKDHPGLFLTKMAQAYQICEGRREPLGQDPRRHVSPADHRGQHHPQHRRLLGRAGRLPRRRFAGPEGAGHGRDELPEYLQAHPRQGLRRAFSASSTARASPASRARRRSSKPTAPPTISRKEETRWTKRTNDNGVTRRDFIKTASAASMATLVAAVAGSGGRCAAGDDVIRIGVIGCGGRGTGAAINAVEAAPGVEILALYDPFQDRIDELAQSAQGEGPGRRQGHAGDLLHGIGRLQEAPGHQEDQLHRHRRPARLPAAPPRRRIKAGKNVFMEKPVAVDPVGVRSVIASSALAAKKGLAIVAGTQRRHEQNYLETMKRIHDGAIGEIVGGQCYWNQGELWVIKQTPEMSDMEWQCRNWLYFTWISGDHIVEQHVHNIDVMNWAFDATPVKVMAMGGRQVRTAPEYGNIFDHFAVEFEYPNGVRVASQCRQIKGCADRVEEKIVGTKGHGLRLRRDLRTERLEVRGRRAQPLRRRAHRPHRQHPRAASRSTRASASPRARSAPSWAA